jgi:hypothetical protein
MRVVLLVGGAAALSACAYHPGSFREPGKYFQGERATVGCLDFAVDRRGDYEESAVFEYSFGNRCNQPVTLDLASLAVWATAESGEQFQLYPYDPKSEVRALPIEGRLFGHEVIAYPLPQPATRVCINVATISPPHEEPAQWMCFDKKKPTDAEPVLAEAAEAPVAKGVP